MPDILTLDDAKQFLRVEVDAHDDLIAALLTAAIRFGERSTGRAAAALEDEDRALFLVAVQMVLAHWYKNPEAVAIGASIAVTEVPIGASTIFGLLADVSIG